MARKMAQGRRTTAIVNDAWERIKNVNDGIAPTWNYLALRQLVDRILTDHDIQDGRDLGDAIVLCHTLGETPTMDRLVKSMTRIDKGRQGVVGYR